MSAPIYHKDDVRGIRERARRNAELQVEPCSVTVDTVSPAIQRVEATLPHITYANKLWIFFGIFLVSYSYGLDSILRYNYQPIAVSNLGDHSLLATVSVVRAVIAAAAQVNTFDIDYTFGS
jgi:SIT family siderophore-iron:H+ symporter-like MFS transporter